MLANDRRSWKRPDGTLYTHKNAINCKKSVGDKSHQCFNSVSGFWDGFVVLIPVRACWGLCNMRYNSWLNLNNCDILMVHNVTSEFKPIPENVSKSPEAKPNAKHPKRGETWSGAKLMTRNHFLPRGNICNRERKVSSGRLRISAAPSLDLFLTFSIQRKLRCSTNHTFTLLLEIKNQI